MLRWITELHPDECEDGMTPRVEERLGSEIRVEWDRRGPDVGTRIERLVAEINEGTGYRLRVVAGKHGPTSGRGLCGMADRRSAFAKAMEDRGTEGGTGFHNSRPDLFSNALRKRFPEPLRRPLWQK